MLNAVVGWLPSSAYYWYAPSNRRSGRPMSQREGLIKVVYVPYGLQTSLFCRQVFASFRVGVLSTLEFLVSFFHHQASVDRTAIYRKLLGSEHGLFYSTCSCI